ncbi:MAG TPA: type IX secretion system sortase PorU, partial [Cyclobacteriaceae bacterium]
TEIRIRFDLPGIVENSDIRIVSQVMSQSQDETSFKLYLNNIEVKEQKIAPIPGTQYGIKGRKAMDTITFSSASVNASSQTSQEVKYQYNKSSSKRSVGYLDFLTINTQRRLSWTGNQFRFTSAQSLQNPVSTFEVSSLPSDGKIWEVSDALNTHEQIFSGADNKASFSSNTSGLKKFVAFTDATIKVPSFESAVSNQNLFSSSAVDLLIVTHPNFKSEALRLAAHRQNYNHITVQVVTTDEIYNEFSGGKQDLTAIRDFARLLYLSANLKNLLLFGRCSYDYKDRIVDNTNFVPTYESRNSLSPLETYSSDDYFGFFDSNEGDWLESPVQNHTMEIGVGRLSIKKIADAQNIVDKLISYDLNKNTFGHWRKDILFVADDGDFNIHQNQSNQMADEIEQNHPVFNTTKLFLDSYKQKERPSGQYSDDATNTFNRAINKGALIVNFTGHGSEQVWMQEKILDPSSIGEWKNKNQFPLFVTATCEFGRHDDPLLISSGELILTRKNAGAIGLVTTARPVNSSTNFILNKAFYNSLFQKVNGKNKDLGAVFRDTKNRSLSGVSNRNFSFLGDPSMKLAIPEKEITISEIKTANDSDTLKALSTVTIKGQITNAGSEVTNFSGILQATLFDKRSEQNTLGDENPVFTFKTWDHIIFQGTATVTSGMFEFNCIVPVSIAQEVGNGKLSLYSYNDTFTDQAAGFSNNFKVGETDINSDLDNQGPLINLFLGDTTYRDGGAVATNTHLVAVLSDEHGIDISGYENGNLEITLDDSITFIGNSYYEAFMDDFTKGMMSYPISDLAKGAHVLRLKSADTYGNLTEKSITFSIGDENQLIIDSFNNYPNPFPEKTTFQFTHNRPGEDLEAQLVVYNSVGQVINTMQFAVPESLYNVTLTDWYATMDGTKLNNGIYFVKLLVRSLSDGAKNEKLTKLIILN